MLTSFDDYFVHQTPRPVAVSATTDRNAYDRFWFNGYTDDGTLYLGIGSARYPNLGIQDCGLTAIHDGVQYAFHASRRMPDDPSDMTVGPFRIQILEPMRRLRVVLEDNDTGIGAELEWTPRTASFAEDYQLLDRSLINSHMEATRFNQFGRWTGEIRLPHATLAVEPDRVWGTKDRSWGIRPLAGGDPRGAPAAPAQHSLFFLWAPLNFDDLGFHYQLFEDSEGRPVASVGALMPTYDRLDDLPGIEDPATRHMRSHEHRLQFDEGSRLAHTAELWFTAVDDGRRHEVRLERILTFRMKGIGYHHPEWGHGMWKGELAIDSERWDLAEVDDQAFENQHCQHVVRATLGARVGLGVLEQLVVGPYLPYGLEGFVGRTG